MRIEISEPTRPIIPEYGISEGSEGLVSWSKVNEWMGLSKNYWISTVWKDKPHSRPIWGIWLDAMFYFGGGSSTRTAKNLLANPKVTITTESGSQAVMVEGIAVRYNDPELDRRLGSLYEQRYGMFHPPPFWRVMPQTVFAWSIDDFANSPTKFTCRPVDDGLQTG